MDPPPCQLTLKAWSGGSLLFGIHQDWIDGMVNITLWLNRSEIIAVFIRTIDEEM